MRNLLRSIAFAASCVAMMNSAQAAEIEIGDAVEIHGMSVGAVYLQSVKMAPELPGMDKPTDIHLEADIKALAGNKHGFPEDAWIPYVTVTYLIEKLGSDWKASGTFLPMCANDGPHYGDNVKLDGPGKYKLTYTMTPPAYSGFYRHTDKETGTDEWWAPFSLDWEFAYVGVGKKGGY